jgi:hypothetical protein
MKISAVCLVLAIGACGGNNGGGPGGGDDDPGADAAVTPMCSSDADCSSDFPICNDVGSCVQCESSADCSEDLPVCGNGTCQASCAGDSIAADFVTMPSDIIWVVDQSGSMDQETSYVQAQINNFATLIGASGIDYRVTMIAISDSGSNTICVPSPLSNGSCGNNTNFRLVNQRIGSHDGPSRFISRYSSYSDFLRLESQKHIIFVTDDESSISANSFRTQLAGLTPQGMFANYKVHGIYAYGNGLASGCTGAFGAGAAEGVIYTDLITTSGGTRGVICNNDWTQVFNDITAAVVSGSQVSCELNVPSPATGTLDPNQVNVKYQMGGTPPGVTLPQVADAASCGGSGGWYYDVPSAPTTITLCPATCTEVQADANANVSVELGCATQIF